MNPLKHFFVSSRLFMALGGIAALFVASFFVSALYAVAQAVLLCTLGLVLADTVLLFHPRLRVYAERRLPRIFSLADVNTVWLDLHLRYFMPLRVVVIDELPEQLQQRDFSFRLILSPQVPQTFTYTVRPTERGEYEFHDLNLYFQTTLGLVERRITIAHAARIAVYPSVIQMRQYALAANTRISNFQGIKKMRRIGHSYEFDQIKNYVPGDDYRSINWKATGRRGGLMVNQYEDERAQQVYAVIDKSRSMNMPFEGLSLLDYAINTSLAMANIALQKSDRAGLVTFSDQMDTTIKAERSPQQLSRLLEALYNEREHHREANYELLYRTVRRMVQGRSLLLLFTNFESTYAADRILPILRRLNTLHLLVVVFFENTEVRSYLERDTPDVEAIYVETAARQLLAEKQQIVQTFRQYGIQTILTPPAQLSTRTINKYLELKSRGLI